MNIFVLTTVGTFVLPKNLMFSNRNRPIVRQWCMRFEAKHHYFKRLAQGMTNFKNLHKTLAIRHQRLQCIHT